MLVATTYDDKETLLDRHPNSVEHISHLSTLQSPPVLVAHDVDATQIRESLCRAEPPLTEACTQAGTLFFDEIVFTFPHVGGKSPISHNRHLLRTFFQSARDVLAPTGVICLTLARGQGGTTFDAVQHKRKADHWQATEVSVLWGSCL